MLSRRRFFAALAGSVVWAQRQRDAMTVRSTGPEDLEMPLSGFDDYITPIDSFFVRTHVPVPTVDVSQWRLSVEGQVNTPLTLSMDDIRRYPAVEVVSVLECAGNGRRNYVPAGRGVQWAAGAVGKGCWRGGRLDGASRRA